MMFIPIFVGNVGDPGPKFLLVLYLAFSIFFLPGFIWYCIEYTPENIVQNAPMWVEFSFICFCFIQGAAIWGLIFFVLNKIIK